MVCVTRRNCVVLFRLGLCVKVKYQTVDNFSRYRKYKSRDARVRRVSVAPVVHIHAFRRITRPSRLLQCSRRPTATQHFNMKYSLLLPCLTIAFRHVIASPRPRSPQEGVLVGVSIGTGTTHDASLTNAIPQTCVTASQQCRFDPKEADMLCSSCGHDLDFTWIKEIASSCLSLVRQLETTQH